jgi:hypothetical protein
MEVGRCRAATTGCRSGDGGEATARGEREGRGAATVLGTDEHERGRTNGP